MTTGGVGRRSGGGAGHAANPNAGGSGEGLNMLVRSMKVLTREFIVGVV